MKSENTFNNLNFKSTLLFEKEVKHEREETLEDEEHEVAKRLAIAFQVSN